MSGSGALRGGSRGDPGDEARDALRRLAGLRGCRVGLCAEGLEGPLAGVRTGIREDEAFPSASLIKLLVLAELLRQADGGRASLDDELLVEEDDLVEDSEMLEARALPAKVSCRELAEGMITASDNAATNLLTRRVGAGRVNALAREIGLGRTVMRRRMMDFAARSRGEENTTSARDMVALLREIWGGTTFGAASREFALGLLLGQRLESRMAFSPPPGARYAHKTGELEGVEHDAGILLLPGRSFALALLVEGDIGRAVGPVSRAAGALCGFYAGAEGSGPGTGLALA